MTTVIDATSDGERRDVFGEERIEVDDRELRIVSAPAVAASRVKSRLDELATRLTYGR